MTDVKLLALDFDGVCGVNPDDMYNRCCNAAIATVRAYLDIGFDEAYDLVIKSWNTYHDVMRIPSEDPRCCGDYQTMTHHYDMVNSHDLHVNALDGLTPILSSVMDTKDVIILSHSCTGLVKKIGMTKTGMPRVLMDRHTYGIDHPTIDFRRKDYHDAKAFGDRATVYDVLSDKFNAHGPQCMLVDDSLVNLKFAKEQAGWQTMHIHWAGNNQSAYPDGRPDYVDYDAHDLVAGLKAMEIVGNESLTRLPSRAVS